MNRSGPAIGKLLTKYSIQPEPSGLFSERKVRAALHANMDKRKIKVALLDDKVANAMSDLRAGDTVVRRVLRSEGHVTRADITFNDVRLADGIVKVLRQHQEYEVAKSPTRNSC